MAPQTCTGNTDGVMTTCCPSLCSPSPTAPAEKTPVAGDQFDMPAETKQAQTQATPESKDEFGEPAESEQADQPNDDANLFGDATKTNPIQTPATSDSDDLFSEPAASEQAIEPSAAADLFGDAAVANPSTRPSTPDFDDLFGEAAENEPVQTEPAVEKKLEDAVDDVLRTPAEQQQDETQLDETQPLDTPPPSADDGLFDTPAQQPAGAAEDLLGLPGDDFSNSNSTNDDRMVSTTDPGGFTSRELRIFVDDTGVYRCRGRLIRVWGDQVQLLKDNGYTATFPVHRLSAVDRDFVQGQLAAQSIPAGNRTAAK